MTHLINTILRTKKFPKILKVSRILPISKPLLDKNFIKNYRPLNNLCSVEKIVESHILHHMEIFYEKNDILNKNLHGGRKYHSTVTAMTQIYNYIYKNDDEAITTVILATDLSSCYDTIDTEILLNKLEHYGIRGEWNNLFRSYFTERQQFVRLENANSTLIKSLECSIVQGSRLSGIFWNTYCNEIPLLPNLINTNIYHKLVCKSKLPLKQISHHVVSFIDDSSNVIGFKQHDKIKLYLEKYYTLLNKFYNINKLKLNNDKNKLLIINKRRLNDVFKNFTFMAGDEKVHVRNKIKIL